MTFDHSKWPAKPPLSVPMKKGGTKSAQKMCRHFEEPRGTNFHILSNFRYLTYAIFFFRFYQYCRTRCWLSFELLNTKNGWCWDRKKSMLRWRSNFWLWKILEKFFVKIFVKFFLHIIFESVLHPQQKNWPPSSINSCWKSKFKFFFDFNDDFRNRNIPTRG